METLKGEVLYAYAAGIIDGEGSIDIYRVNTSVNKRFALRVSMGHTNQWLVEFFHFNFGGNIHCSPSLNPKHKDCWFWTVAATKAAVFLNIILPYLQIKKSQAELALNFQARKRKRFSPLTDEEKALEEADRILMKSYNRKGKEQTL